MGGMIKDTTTSDVMHQLNTRLGAGDAIQEMAGVHKEFGVFSKTSSLQKAYRTLHIVPADFKERSRWYKFLDSLSSYDSDQPGVNGHDRILNAYRDNLESKKPLPIYTTTHRMADDKRVLVSTGQPVVHENQDYLVVSIPTVPRGETPPAEVAAAAKPKRAAKK